MQIKIKFFATLRQDRPNSQLLEIEENTAISDVFSILKIDQNKVSIIMVNGIIVEPAHILKSEDVLALFPPVGGG